MSGDSEKLAAILEAATDAKTIAARLSLRDIILEACKENPAMSEVIPAEAVEAANEAVFRKFNGIMRPALVKVVLEAAAPHMLAAAWEEGRLVGRAEEQSGFDTEMNPYAI